MNFILVTIPIRPKNTDFPPVGITALLDTLIKAGYQPKFYDIDGLRPSFEQVVDFFRREKPDILGVSAVVSTAYRYTKELTHAVKEVSPKTKIILGGCLAASAEILLRKCPIDICVIGEGEKVLMNLIKYWEKFYDFDSRREEFQKIKGIAFIDSENNFIFSGYEQQLLPEELAQPNYELLSKYSNISLYITDPLKQEIFAGDQRSYQPHRLGKKCCFVMTAKGCVSRCAFCHRWIKGYRSYPIENIINTMRYLKTRYNIGFFKLGDESFGANPGMLNKFIDEVRPLDILFSIGATRVSTICRNPGIVRKLKEAGCVQMIFGMESGSDKILTIMGKGASSKQNLEVARLLIKEGLDTALQLVIGMPGENYATIKETIECLKLATEDMNDYPYKRLSINYFQALPGTPGYEFVRSRNLIGKTLDEEEAYLLKISDIDASSRRHYRNVSEDYMARLLLWPHRISTETTIHWYKRRGWKSLDAPEKLPTYGAGNRAIVRIWSYLRTKRIYFRIASLMGESFWSGMLFAMRMRIYGLRKAVFFTLGIMREDDRSPFIIRRAKPLRELITYPDPSKVSISEANMIPLRKGR